MWTIIKFDKKKINLLKEDFKKKLGDKPIVYEPKVLINVFKKCKRTSKELNVLGDYLFCYHRKFEDKTTLNKVKFSRGLKYFLNGCFEFQEEIDEFINKCKKLENENGYISASIFELNQNTKYKFSSGPFADKIFKIISLQKNKLDILMGNIKTSVEKSKYLFNPI